MSSARVTEPDEGTLERWRLFVALPLPSAARERLRRQLQPYRRAFPGARWLDPGTWHVTLLFLGHVPRGRAPAVAGACASAASGWPPFDVDVRGGGGRVREAEGVAWLRVRSGAGDVIGLSDGLARALRQAGFGDASLRRAPSAHVTVARRADGSLTGALATGQLGRLAAGWRVEELRLMRSHLGREGARYEVLEAVPLTGG